MDTESWKDVAARGRLPAEDELHVAVEEAVEEGREGKQRLATVPMHLRDGGVGEPSSITLAPPRGWEVFCSDPRAEDNEAVRAVLDCYRSK